MRYYVLFNFVFPLLGITVWSQNCGLDSIAVYPNRYTANYEYYCEGFEIHNFKSTQIFMIGEVHQEDIYYKHEFALIKILNKKYDVNNIICEYPYSFGIYLNNYINRIDSNHARVVVETNLCESKIAFWRSVRAYNDSLPENKKIEVLTVDAEDFHFGISEIIKVLSLDTLNTPFVLDIKNRVTTLQKKRFISRHKKFKILAQIRNEIGNYAIGNHMGLTVASKKRLTKILDGLLITLNNPDKIDEFHLLQREEYMMNSILNSISDSSKYVGIFGLMHLTKFKNAWISPNFKSWSSLVSMLIIDKNVNITTIILDDPLILTSTDEYYFCRKEKNIYLSKYGKSFAAFALNDYSRFDIYIYMNW